MTEEQTQLLREILEELKALREMTANVTEGGNAMVVQPFDVVTSCCISPSL